MNNPKLPMTTTIELETGDAVAVHVRDKNRRTRIKEHRARRHRRRFYVCLPDGKERARDTGVRSKPFTLITQRTK